MVLRASLTMATASSSSSSSPASENLPFRRLSISQKPISASAIANLNGSVGGRESFNEGDCFYYFNDADGDSENNNRSPLFPNSASAKSSRPRSSSALKGEALCDLSNLGSYNGGGGKSSNVKLGSCRTGESSNSSNRVFLRRNSITGETTGNRRSSVSASNSRTVERRKSFGYGELLNGDGYGGSRSGSKIAEKHGSLANGKKHSAFGYGDSNYRRSSFENPKAISGFGNVDSSYSGSSDESKKTSSSFRYGDFRTAGKQGSCGNEEKYSSLGYGGSSDEGIRFRSTKSFDEKQKASSIAIPASRKSFSESSLNRERRPPPSRQSSLLSARESLLAEAWERKRELMLNEELANMKERTLKPELLGRSSSDCGKAVMKKKNAAAATSELRRCRTRSLTDEDFEELRGCIDLGFQFDQSSVPHLCETLPALEVFCAVQAQNLQDSFASPTVTMKTPMSPTPSSPYVASHSTAARCSSPSTPSWRISSPGDDPNDVKGRLRHWAQAVAFNARLCY